MTWKSITPEELELCKQFMLYVQTARNTGYAFVRPDGWPAEVDIIKSALFERIRSGKQPLDEPPPIGFACPWYAVVEDPGPHFVGTMGDDVRVAPTIFGNKMPNVIIMLQSHWEIVEQLGFQSYIVRDGYHSTSYRFDLWYDSNWRHPSIKRWQGGWFLRNIKFRPEQALNEHQ